MRIKNGPTIADRIDAALTEVDNDPAFQLTYIDEFIQDYSRANGLDWHTGYAENKQVKARFEAVLRVAIPENKKKFQKKVEAGKWVHLNGTKLAGRKAAIWNRGRKICAPSKSYKPVDGMSYPAIEELNVLAHSLVDGSGPNIESNWLDAGLVKPNAKGDSPLSIAAKYQKKARKLFIDEKTRDLNAIYDRDQQIKEQTQQILYLESDDYRNKLAERLLSDGSFVTKIMDAFKSSAYAVIES